MKKCESKSCVMVNGSATKCVKCLTSYLMSEEVQQAADNNYLGRDKYIEMIANRKPVVDGCLHGKGCSNVEKLCFGTFCKKFFDPSKRFDMTKEVNWDNKCPQSDNFEFMAKKGNKINPIKRSKRQYR